jgi:hypothetical protein
MADFAPILSFDRGTSLANKGHNSRSLERSMLHFAQIVLLIFLPWLITACAGEGVGSPSALEPSGGTATVSVTIAWNSNGEPDLAGYKVYQGTASGQYGAPIAVLSSMTTRHAVSGLEQGRTYFLTITAFDQSGNESPPSNEIMFTIQQPVL